MLQIPQAIVDAILAQALRESPDEACGLLAGAEGRAQRQYPLTNTDHSPEHFSIDPAEHFRVMKEARSQGLHILANYHSHPATPARPSVEDIRLAYDPNILSLILSLAEATPVLRAFRIRDGQVEPVEIIITEQ